MNSLENLRSRSIRTGEYIPTPIQAGPSTDPCSLIEGRVQCLFAQVGELSDKLDKLEKKIYPALGPIGIADSGVTGNNVELPPQSELSSKLNDVVTQLNFAIERISTLISRVEL